MKSDINLQAAIVCARLLNYYLTTYLATFSQLVYEQIMKIHFSSLKCIWKISAPTNVLGRSWFFSPKGSIEILIS